MEGKVALVTGGGGGIGRASVELLAREGARVVIAEYNEETGEAARQAVLAGGGEAIFVPTDVSDETQMKALVDTAIRTYGKIDVLHNNVGGSTLNDGPITQVSNDEFWLKMRVDVFGTWLGCRLVIPHMIENGGGSIVNMTSVNAIIGVKGRNAYAAAKGAVSSLTRALAVQYAEFGIRVNCIAPGRTLTERVMARQGNRKPTDLKDDSHLLGLIEPAEVARTVLYLATEDSSKTTGQVLVVDSGLTIQ
ncbi:SDR family oxidoreductase [Sphingobium sp. H39-3-25]|uniref:SDR family NAD(P)-dependent oxidoreductase n=1 Tax=Sphingobium arseniciresistens TaxID=3030834 RepID=UPI0023B9377A|nr:SDR family oxidoreductase [Sphingobium arseniciresistens]